MTKYNYCPQMAEKDCGLSMFPDLQDNLNDLSVVDQLSMVTSSRTGLLIFKAFKTIDLDLTE